MGPLTNRVLVGVILFSAGLQLALYELPSARALFGLGELHLWELGLAFALGFIPVTALELSKLLFRPRRRAP